MINEVLLALDDEIYIQLERDTFNRIMKLKVVRQRGNLPAVTEWQYVTKAAIRQNAFVKQAENMSASQWLGRLLRSLRGPMGKYPEDHTI